MSGNVHDQLSKTRPSLVARIIKNEQVTQMFMGYINILHGLRKIHAKPVESLSFGPLQELPDNVFVSHLTWGEIKPGRAAMWLPSSEMAEYAKSRAAHFAETLRLNPDIGKFFEDTVTALENWAAHNQCDWINVEIDAEPPNHAVITRDLQQLRFRVKKKLGLSLVRA